MCRGPPLFGGLPGQGLKLRQVHDGARHYIQGLHVRSLGFRSSMAVMAVVVVVMVVSVVGPVMPLVVMGMASATLGLVQRGHRCALPEAFALARAKLKRQHLRGEHGQAAPLLGVLCWKSCLQGPSRITFSLNRRPVVATCLLLILLQDSFQRLLQEAVLLQYLQDFVVLLRGQGPLLRLSLVVSLLVILFLLVPVLLHQGSAGTLHQQHRVLFARARGGTVASGALSRQGLAHSLWRNHPVCGGAVPVAHRLQPAHHVPVAAAGVDHVVLIRHELSSHPGRKHAEVPDLPGLGDLAPALAQIRRGSKAREGSGPRARSGREARLALPVLSFVWMSHFIVHILEQAEI
mmetsp:Transcript_43483/g.103626  ORF Transcript_43483/g.103626 Transcript_43483/m.103626 type:complete len:348 (+) Transcript_43483:963-2006(+)